MRGFPVNQLIFNPVRMGEKEISGHAGLELKPFSLLFVHFALMCTQNKRGGLTWMSQGARFFLPKRKQLTQSRCANVWQLWSSRKQ